MILFITSAGPREYVERIFEKKNGTVRRVVSVRRNNI